MDFATNLETWWADFYSGDAAARANAVAALSAAPLPAVLPHLLAALRDADLTLVTAACDMVAAQGAQQAYPILAERAAAG